MEKLDMGVYIIYKTMAIWDSTVWVIVLLTRVRYLMCTCLTGLMLSSLQGVLVFPFGLPKL